MALPRRLRIPDTFGVLVLVIMMLIAFVSTLPFLASPNTLLRLAGDELQLISSTLPGIGAVSGDNGLKHDVPLVVGGTDGSGTRSVVCLLDALGVPMIIDNHRTLDVEGKELGVLDIQDPAEPSGRRTIRGWPAVVRQVMERTKSADYDPSELPRELHENLKRRLMKFWSSTSKRGRRSRILAGKRASKAVSWGLKAPVTMLLLPMLYEYMGLPNFRFLHVVRDGRDISYSGNQSPVKKFYNITFPPEEDGGAHWIQNKDTPEVRGIELWSLWNSQLLGWENRTVSKNKFDYMVLHVEDLVARGPEARQAAIQEVSSFVGAQLSVEEICCLSITEQESLGSHTEENWNTVVSSRFGKWKKKATDETVALLNGIGDAGLKAFGYEPYDRPSDQVLDQSRITTCDASMCKDLQERDHVLGIHNDLCSGDKDRDAEDRPNERRNARRRAMREKMHRNARMKRGRQQ